MTFTVAQIAAQIGGEVEGDSSLFVSGLASLSEAQAGDLSFLTSSRYDAQMKDSRATAVVVGRKWGGEHAVPALLRVENPDKAFAEIALLFAPPPPSHPPGVHPAAIIHPTATLGAGVHIGPYVVIEAEAHIEDNCVVEAFVFIGRSARVGAGSHLYPHVSIREHCVVGERFIAHNGAVVGSDGFGYNVAPVAGGLPRIDKIPQVGIVVIGHDVEIGANSTIDRARFGATRIGNHVKIDNLVQIAHNVRIDDCSGVIAQAGIAGSSHIGSGVMVWAQAGISGHLRIGDGAQIGPQAGVARDVAANSYVIGSPAGSMRELAAANHAGRNLMKLRKRVTQLEARLEQIDREPTIL